MKTSGFTLIELVVVITILAILSTVAFVSFSRFTLSAQNSTRTADFANLKTNLKLTKQRFHAYPKFQAASSGSLLYLLRIGNLGVFTGAIQGYLDESVTITNQSSIPRDPRTQGEYGYAYTPSRQEYQIATTLDSDDGILKAYVDGDYKTVAPTVLPTLFLALVQTGSVDIVVNSGAFILNKGSWNLLYDMQGSVVRQLTNASLGTILSESGVTNTFMNSSYTDCDSIKEEQKFLGSGSFYQVINENGDSATISCAE
jgi:prepilin-type N-terminal cleavage/methylation domain-containing protein